MNLLYISIIIVFITIGLILIFKKCKPNCTNKTCGSDGCGGQCGSCLRCTECAGNSCAPVANGCINKQCGTDGCYPCGPLGGKCASGQVCDTNGQCNVLQNGKIDIMYKDPISNETSCLYVTSGSITTASQFLNMQPVDSNGNCPPAPSITYGNQGVEITNSFPNDLGWVYNNGNLTWHSDIGFGTECLTQPGKPVQCQQTPYIDQQACMYCTNNIDPTTCNQMNAGLLDNCDSGYYNGKNLNYVNYTPNENGTLEASFSCPDGSKCPSTGLCSDGTNCRQGGVLLVPCSSNDPEAQCTTSEIRPVVVTSSNKRVNGWLFRNK